MKFVIIVIINSFMFTMYGQTDSLLLSIKNKLASTRSYQCDCKYSNSLIGNSTINQKMVLVRNSNDTICGFYFRFFNDSSFPPLLDNFDYAFYNGNAVYKSYHGKIKQTIKSDNPEKFVVIKKVDKSGGVWSKPSELTSLFLYQVTLFELEKELNKYLSDSDTRIYRKNDTIINTNSCIHYILTNGIIKINYYFDKNSFYPVRYSCAKTGPIGSQTVKSDFFNVKDNTNIPLEYFSEANLLPDFHADKTTYLQTILIGSNAPIWTLPLLNSTDSLSLVDLRGKLILLDFTATWCVPCRFANEMMTNLQSKYASNQNVVLISAFLDDEENQKNITQMLQTHKVNYKVLYGANNIWNSYKQNGVPAFIIIDTNGKIIDEIKGFSDKTEREISSKIDKLIRI